MERRVLHTTFLAILFFIVVSMSSKVSAEVIDCESVRNDEQICVACNVYFEAATTQSFIGSLGIATVTAMRIKDERYPDTFCKVVWQHKQFSWTDDGKPDKVRTREKAWQMAMAIAKMVALSNFTKKDIKKLCPYIDSTHKMWEILERNGVRVKRRRLTCEDVEQVRKEKLKLAEEIDPTGGATHFHAKYVKPKWAKGKRPSAVIGDHVFYVGIQ